MPVVAGAYLNPIQIATQATRYHPVVVVKGGGQDPVRLQFAQLTEREYPVKVKLGTSVLDIIAPPIPIISEYGLLRLRVDDFEGSTSGCGVNLTIEDYVDAVVGEFSATLGAPTVSASGAYGPNVVRAALARVLPAPAFVALAKMGAIAKLDINPLVPAPTFAASANAGPAATDFLSIKMPSPVAAFVAKLVNNINATIAGTTNAPVVGFSAIASERFIESVLSSVIASDLLSVVSVLRVNESVVATDAIVTEMTAILTALVRAVDTASVNGNFKLSLADAATAKDNIAFGFQLALASSAQASVLVEELMGLILYSTAVAETVLESQLDGTNQAVVTATVLDAAVFGYLAVLEDTGDALVAVEQSMEAIELGLSTADATAIIDDTQFVVINTVESVVAADEASIQQLLSNDLQSSGIATVSFFASGETYITYALNTVTLGLSEYTDFNFNSFARISDAYYGAKDDGIYKLEGDDYDGNPIWSRVKTGLLDFGDTQVKALHEVVLGYTSDDQLVLKVIGTRDGDKIERWYRLNPQTANATRSGRIKTAKGVRSTHFQLELVNRLGADFSLDLVKVWPLLTRKRS